MYTSSVSVSLRSGTGTPASATDRPSWPGPMMWTHRESFRIVSVWPQATVTSLLENASWRMPRMPEAGFAGSGPAAGRSIPATNSGMTTRNRGTTI